MLRTVLNKALRAAKVEGVRVSRPTQRTSTSSFGAYTTSIPVLEQSKYSKSRILSTGLLFAAPLAAAGVFFASAEENKDGDLSAEEQEKAQNLIEEKKRRKQERRARRVAKRKERKAKRAEEAKKRAETEQKDGEAKKEENQNTNAGPTVVPVTEVPSTKKTDEDDEEEIPVFPSQYVIVGGGPAAYNALEEILHINPEAQILVISEDEHSPYDPSPLSKELLWQRDFESTDQLIYPNWRGKALHLEYRPPAWYNDSNKKVTFLTKRKVTDLDAGRHVITLDDGSQYKYEKCLLAVGTTPKTLSIEFPKENVSQIKTASDFLNLHHKTLDKSIQHITVVGNDYLASDLVDGFVIRAHFMEHGTKVAQVFPDSGVLAGVFPEYFSEYLNGKARSTGVDVHPNVKINAIEETPDAKYKLKITLDNNEFIETDHIVLSLGSTPNLDLANHAYLETDPKNGGVVVNAELQARTDIWVAGDVASYYDAHLGRRRADGIDHAELTGKLAGLNMTGRNKPYTYQPIRWGVTCQKTNYQGVGILDSSLETVGVWQNGPSAPLIPGPEDTLIPNPDAPVSTEYQDNNGYERGVIYYMKGAKVVGVMMINVNGQMEAAKRLVTFPREFTDLNRLRTQIYMGSKPKVDDDEEAAPSLYGKK